MSERLPFLQTLTGFEDSFSAYAIQPVNDDERTELHEENPIFAFGPLGAINIFVGATNAGKSRFMRSLIKTGSYRFHSKETYNLILELTSCAYWLIASKEHIHFAIKNSNFQMSDGSPVVFSGMPSWLKKALPYVQPGMDYDLLLDSKFFVSMLPLIKVATNEFFVKGEPNVKSSPDFSEKIRTAFWARNLIKGEIKARANDMKKFGERAHEYPVQHLESLAKRHSEHLLFDTESVSEEWRDNFVRLFDIYERFRTERANIDESRPQRIYIPTLRSAVSLSDNNGNRLNYDIFAYTVRKNYGINDTKDTRTKIFTGNDLYDTLGRDRNGTPEVVDRLRDFETFLSNSFYDGRRVELVALDKRFDSGEHISVRVQGETPRELHHLGDGINTLIILLYQLFMAEPGSWVFIEEPELNLHPGLQRLFLQTIMQNEALQKRQLKVFFTTHSNHLLRMTLTDGTIATENISIFAFQQRGSDQDSFLIRPLVTEHHQALALLGVQNASVLMAQCGIWVEGVTDRQYIRAYLNAYQNSDEFKQNKLSKMREDTNFAFWEYAGSNLSHYFMSVIPRKDSKEAEEYERGQKAMLDGIQSSALCNRIFLIADRDDKKEKKHTALKELAAGKGNFAYYKTACVEIENLLSPNEIIATLPTFFGGKIVPSVVFSQADYKDIRMGRFLLDKYPSQCNEEWVAETGTLITRRKNRFCELAVQHISWNTMSKEAKTLAKELHEFINKHNNI